MLFSTPYRILSLTSDGESSRKSRTFIALSSAPPRRRRWSANWKTIDWFRSIYSNISSLSFLFKQTKSLTWFSAAKCSLFRCFAADFNFPPIIKETDLKKISPRKEKKTSSVNTPWRDILEYEKNRGWQRRVFHGHWSPLKPFLITDVLKGKGSLVILFDKLSIQLIDRNYRDSWKRIHLIEYLSPENKFKVD